MKRCNITLIVIVGFLLRFIFVTINYKIAILPQGGADAIGFERLAWNYVVNGRENLAHYLHSGPLFLSYLGSYVYEVTARSPYALGTLTAMLGTALIYVGYKAALIIWEDVRTARIVAWTIALFPQLVLHSAIFLREIPVSFFFLLALMFGARYIIDRNPLYILSYGLFIFFASLFHSGIIFAIPALAVGIAITRATEQRRNLKLYIVNVSAGLGLICLILAINEIGYGLDKFGGSLDDTLMRFEEQELREASGGAAFPDWLQIRGGLGDMWKIPVRLIAFLFAPLIPFLVRTPSHLLGLIDAALYLFFFWQLYKSRQIIKENRSTRVLVLVFLMTSLVYAMGVSNFGTAIRHRAKLVPALIVIAAGLPEVRRRHRQIWMKSQLQDDRHSYTVSNARPRQVPEVSSGPVNT